MSEDASYELQRAMVSTLKANAALTALIAGRVYDHVPQNSATGAVTAQFPYISFGPEQDIPEDYDCVDASEIIFQIDVWSRDPGFMEAKRIANAVKVALSALSLPVGDNALVYFAFDGRRALRDPDGLTSHVVMTFRAGVEKH
jgi:hypothetical protein